MNYSKEVNAFTGSIILWGMLLGNITSCELLNIIFICILGFITSISLNCESKMNINILKRK
jgi:hypothetical protein